MDTLWQGWMTLQASMEEALHKNTAHYFSCIKKTAWNRLALDALTLARLGQKDEGIYSHLQYLMATYREVVTSFEAGENNSDLVGGLCDILNSRQRQFEDVATESANPIAKEKQAIIERALLHTATQIEAFEQEYNPTEPLLESIIEYILPPLDALYQENLTRCLAGIDDLHNRKSAAFFTDLLEREWEVLGLIIQVQVKAIESVGFDTENTAPVLSKLREAYQQTGPVVSGFRKLMQNTTPALPQPAGFTEEILTTPPIVEIDTTPMLTALEQEADILLGKIRCKELVSAQSLHQLAESEIELSEDVISTFETTQFWLASSPKSPESREKEILSGITETITIKIDSLRESLEQFKSNCQGILPTELPVHESKDAASQMLMAWIAAPPAEDSIEAFLYKCMELDAFTAYSDKLTMHITAISAKLDKSILRYRKENLLYEISTYEEILYYSVSRLRESELPQIQIAVDILDETFNALENIIGEAEITTIRPEPHQPFNGKEHEVLTAEEQEGFAKGEIIKTMVSGYKAGDQVILRANVVAAR
ncbi:MAG: nucleotide exchange factor GrpE [Defluviitaleaceae bacterium]|nr:nucleotide exchange factor GrpE [Defluviitaleaceae bacterium]